MSFDFTCPFCSQVMQCEDVWRGMQAKCPTCGKSITLNPSAQVNAPQAMQSQNMAASADNASSSESKKSGGIIWMLLGGMAVVAISFFIYATFFDKVSEDEIIKTSRKLVEEIIEREIPTAHINNVEIKDLTEVSDNHYKATAYISGYDLNGGYETILCSVEIKIEVQGDKLYVEIVPGTAVDRSP